MKGYEKMKTLVIIPAYNEEESIKNTVTNLKKINPNVDYVIINDCSTDTTKEICEKNKFNVINLPINLGIGGAVQTGYPFRYRWRRRPPARNGCPPDPIPPSRRWHTRGRCPKPAFVYTSPF